MSATASPYGMIPVENYGAMYNTQGFETYFILDGYNTSIFKGDVVKLTTTGTVIKDTGTTTLAPLGVFMGCSFIDPSLGYFNNQQAWPASTTTGQPTSSPGYPMAKVVTYPGAIYQIQANGPVAISDIGANAAIVQTAGSLTAGQVSRNALNASSIDPATGTLPLRIVGILNSPTNAPGDAFTDVLVVFNNNMQINTAVGI